MLSYGAAGIVSAVVELPVANVEMAFLGLQLRGGSNPPLLKMDLFIPYQLISWLLLYSSLFGV